jgi:small subunit ribosomal protein S13
MLKLYNNPNQITNQFVKQEKEIYKKMNIKTLILETAKEKSNKKGLKLFILNNFIINIHGNQQIQTILQRVFGIGFMRSFLFSINITYFNAGIAFKRLTASHYKILVNLFEQANYLLKSELIFIKKDNVSQYKAIKCYRGIRHSLYLPVRGQRTHTNAHVARYLGSGTFEYVATRPSLKLKRLSKYSRRKKFLVDASNSRYNRLLTKNYVEFQKKNKYTFKYLVKKNRLGVFGKIFKEKQKLAKTKAKKLKKLNKK